MKGLDAGQFISREGYDEVASATVFEGGGPYTRVIVLNNNSTHYLVCLEVMGAKCDVVFLESFKYIDDHDVLEVYGFALEHMIKVAKEY